MTGDVQGVHVVTVAESGSEAGEDGGSATAQTAGVRNATLEFKAGAGKSGSRILAPGAIGTADQIVGGIEVTEVTGEHHLIGVFVDGDEHGVEEIEGDAQGVEAGTKIGGCGGHLDA